MNKEYICTVCKKPIVFDRDLVTKTDVIYEWGMSPTFKVKRYHERCNMIYDRIININQLKNILKLIFDKKIDVILLQNHQYNLPMWFRVNTLYYSFHIGIQKKSAYPIILIMSEFQQCKYMIDEMDILVSEESFVYIKSYSDLITILQNLISK